MPCHALNVGLPFRYQLLTETIVLVRACSATEDAREHPPMDEFERTRAVPERYRILAAADDGALFLGRRTR